MEYNLNGTERNDDVPNERDQKQVEFVKHSKVYAMTFYAMARFN